MPKGTSAGAKLEKKDHYSEQAKNEARKILNSTVSGAGAGAVAAFFTSPLDVVRTRLMIQHQGTAPPRYQGTWQSLRMIFAEEGAAGLYRGLPPTLVALIPNWAIYFFCYEQVKHAAAQRGFADGPETHIAAAMTAGTVTNVMTNPLWLVRTRIQAHQLYLHQGQKPYLSTLDAFRTIVREEGILSLWNGLTPQLIGVVHVCIQFPLYEYLKKYFMKREGKTHEQLSWHHLVFASSASKIIASSAAYPHEVLRSRMQFQHSKHPEKPKGTLDMIQKIWAKEGVRGFYRGIGTNLFRTVPAAAITLTSYEIIQRFLRRYAIE